MKQRAGDAEGGGPRPLSLTLATPRGPAEHQPRSEPSGALERSNGRERREKERRRGRGGGRFIGSVDLEMTGMPLHGLRCRHAARLGSHAVLGSFAGYSGSARLGLILSCLVRVRVKPLRCHFVLIMWGRGQGPICQCCGCCVKGRD